jgi:hypothetical protein
MQKRCIDFYAQIGPQHQGKSQSVDTEAFAPEALRERSGGHREIYRDCPTSKVRIGRVWPS